MRFLVFIVIVDLLLTATTIIYYRRIFKDFRGVFFTSLYLFLSFNIVLNCILSDAYPLGFLRLEAYSSGLWLGILFYSFIVTVLHSVIYGISWWLGVNLPHKKISLAMMLVFGGIYAFGCWNVFQPIVRYENIVTAKLDKGIRMRIALVSDVHLGRVLGRDFAKGLVTLINRQNPDVVIIAGDLMDGKISQVVRGNSLEPFRELEALYGTYIVLGNHDYLDDTAKWQRIMKLNKIKILQGRTITIMDGKVKIAGLVDFSRDGGMEGLRQLAVGNNDFYSIVVDHQPKRIPAAEEEQYDLYLAGHTHTGQIFPNRLFTYYMYDIDYGRKQYGKMTAIVSSGIGFWGPPARSFTSPEIVVIDIEGMKPMSESLPEK